MAFQATDEQLQAVELFKRRKPLKISAFAGSGKTSTLLLLAQTRPEKGLYIAFNKAIAEEAKQKFPKTVDCRTTHSLAFRPVSGQFRFSSGKMTGSLQPWQLADTFGLRDQQFGRIKLDKIGQAFLALGTVRRFCQSDAPGIMQTHVPAYGRIAAATEEEVKEIRAFVLEKAEELWGRMINHRDRTPLGHDGYLKLWALQEPRFAFDYVLLDEAQDSNPAVLGVLGRQDAQIVYVGDRHQQIYEWRGAINAMEKISGGEESYLTRSFRFGEAIAVAASQILAAMGEKRPIVGNPAVISSIRPVSSPQAILCRTNAGVMAEVIGTLDRNQTPHVVGGVKELIRMLDDVVSLKKSEPGTSPELLGFTNWEEVLRFVQEEEGESLRMFVQLVERFGEMHLLWAVRRVVDNEKDAHVILSTAHKAKGREWDSVRLSPDFASSKSDNPKTLDDAECRLFYVAMTRAKRFLDVAPETLIAFKTRTIPATQAWPVPKPAVSARATGRVTPPAEPRPPTPRPVVISPTTTPGASPPARATPPPLPRAISAATTPTHAGTAPPVPPPAAKAARGGFIQRLASLFGARAS